MENFLKIKEKFIIVGNWTGFSIVFCGKKGELLTDDNCVCNEPESSLIAGCVTVKTGGKSNNFSFH